jgi:hypothetical protein
LFSLGRSEWRKEQNKKCFESWGIGEGFGRQLQDKTLANPNGMSFAVYALDGTMPNGPSLAAHLLDGSIKFNEAAKHF